MIKLFQKQKVPITLSIKVIGTLTAYNIVYIFENNSIKELFIPIF